MLNFLSIVWILYLKLSPLLASCNHVNGLFLCSIHTKTWCFKNITYNPNDMGCDQLQNAKIQQMFKDKNDIKLAHSPTIRFFHIQSFIKVASPPRSLFQQFFMPKYVLPSQPMYFTYISCYINLKRLKVSSWLHEAQNEPKAFHPRIVILL